MACSASAGGPRLARVPNASSHAQALAVRGVRAVDLRPALLTARHYGNTYYQHDTHWTGRGALAAFNAIATALGRPSWRLDPATALGPEVPRIGGDLARMLGVAKESVELDQPLALPLGDYHPISALSQLGEVDAVYLGSAQMSPTFTVAILGDSFTQGYFAPMILSNGSGVVWSTISFATSIGTCSMSIDPMKSVHAD
jgi:hypothetical protein